jgi:hypothetical protein
VERWQLKDRFTLGVRAKKALGPTLRLIQGHKLQHLLVTCGQIEKKISLSALTPSVKPLGLISTFAPIEMLDLGWTLAPTPSVKRAYIELVFCVEVYKKIQLFTSISCQLVGYVDNFYDTCVSVCQERVWLLWVMNQLRGLAPKENRCQTNLIKIVSTTCPP